MSNYHYYRCLDHEPPLVADQEISQHGDRYVDFAIRFAQGEAEWRLGDGISPFLGDWVRMAAIEFLRRHPNCAMDIVDESGRAVPIPGREKAGTPGTFDGPGEEFEPGEDG